MAVEVASRVAVIVLDGAEWTLLEPMLEAGELPNLERLRRRAAVALIDDPDWATGLVWQHFVTGSGPERNAQWNAVSFDPGSYEVWQDGAGRDAFFETSPPLQAVLFDVPHVGLAHAVDGAIVTDWGAHDPGYPRASRPRGLLREIDETFGAHPASHNCYETAWNDERAIEALAEGLVTGADRRPEITRWLLQRFPDWKLFVTVMSETHTAGEQWWFGVDPDSALREAPTAPAAARRLRDVYRAVDDAVGRTVDALPDGTTVMVAALHGMTRNDDIASMVLLPELLHRMEFGTPLVAPARDPEEWVAAGCPPVVLEPDERWGSFMARRFPPEAGPIERARRAVGAVAPAPVRSVYRRIRGRSRGRSPGAPSDGGGRTVGVLGRVIPSETERSAEEIGVPRSHLEWQVPSRYRRRWPEMQAFALPTFFDGRIRLNVAGREARGVVDPSDYDAVCDRIEGMLLRCRDVRTDEPAVEAVHRLRSDDPTGAGGPEADLQVLWSRDVDAVRHPDLGVIGPFPHRRTGAHSDRGFAFLAGPGVEPRDLGHRAALDIPATLLALLGRESVHDVDGMPFLTSVHT